MSDLPGGYSVEDFDPEKDTPPENHDTGCEASDDD